MRVYYQLDEECIEYTAVELYQFSLPCYIVTTPLVATEACDTLHQRSLAVARREAMVCRRYHVRE